ncbi:OmpA family protein [candidate division KSB3 bacterium]|uniref:OmpA family protein n=1 Tax=candidate division KSB3 bacterium TaxID=2044937 RepID=A0A9D5Q8C9_9BACT|nr:OmpA family protein [candidate division KSB3 bacterium]MBD3327207.1 OmpA family protein [candidate division KSB3 bacterium]
MKITYHRETMESFPFIGYIDTLAAIVLVFVVITAFTAIAFTLNKQATLQAQQEVQAMQTELQQYRDQLEKRGYRNIQEIPDRTEWRNTALTQQVLANTGWTGRVADLPVYEDWQQMKHYSPQDLQHLTESEEQLIDVQQRISRYTDILAKAGYADIAEIPSKEEWEKSQVRLKSFQNLLEDVGFRGDIEKLYSFIEQWNQIILEMKRVFKVQTDEPQQVLEKLERLESLQKKVVIPVTQGSIFFASGQAKIRDEFKQVLDAHIEEARAAIKSGTYDLIQIEGHTDSVPIRPDHPLYRDNWELSVARAQAVAQYFIERGIPQEHLAVVGHAEFKPRVPGNSPEALAQNRRIEIVFLNSSLLNVGIAE